MEIQIFINSLFDNNYFLVIAAFSSAFTISYVSIPRILAVARAKYLYDEPNGRTSHKVKTPTLGGVAIFASFVISSLVFLHHDQFHIFQYIIASISIMFFIGLKDDILLITPWKKLLGQIIASLILILLGDVRFKTLNGFIGIQEISYLASVFISLFVYIVVINCINLVDGVDGLASGLSILTSAIFAIWFFLNGEAVCVLISVTLLGALIPFFIYNVFGKKNKLFMGDTGALIIGLIGVVLIIQFNEFSNSYHYKNIITVAPAMSIAIFFIPLYDTLQVFVRRLSKGKSPFSPDKNHLHHHLLKLGFTHIQTSLTLISINALVIVFSFYMQFLGILSLSFILLFIGITISLVLRYFISTKISGK